MLTGVQEMGKDLGNIAKLIRLEPVHCCVVLCKQLIEDLSVLLLDLAKP